MSTTPTTATVVPSPPADGGPEVDVRLTLLVPEPGRATTLDGAWWPRSRDLAAELPALVAELHRRRDVRVTRVAYNTDLWDVVPRHVTVDERVIRVGWFRSVDPNAVSLTDNGTNRVDLLVIPPDTSAATAHRAMASAGAAGNRETATSLLAAAGAPPAAPAHPLPPGPAPRAGGGSHDG